MTEQFSKQIKFEIKRTTFKEKSGKVSDDNGY